MLTIQQLSYRYNNSAENSLTDINLDICSGEVFALLGPNGAGKTTLISLISGLLPRSDKCIVFGGGKDSTRLSLVPQEYAFYPMLSAKENLEFFGAVQGLSAKALKVAIDRVVHITGLERQLKKQASHFSGGLKRRLNLAIGLLNDPNLLLLDEPTVGVDPQSRAFILEAIKRLAQTGKTIIYTSHYMEEVEYLCQRIAIMDQGRILLAGDLASLLEGQKKSSIEIHLGSLSTLQLTQLQHRFESAELDGGVLRFGQFSERLLADFFDWSVQYGVQVNRIHYGPQHLEDLFLMLTKRSLRD